MELGKASKGWVGLAGLSTELFFGDAGSGDSCIGGEAVGEPFWSNRIGAGKARSSPSDGGIGVVEGTGVVGLSSLGSGVACLGAGVSCLGAGLSGGWNCGVS